MKEFTEDWGYALLVIFCVLAIMSIRIWWRLDVCESLTGVKYLLCVAN